MDAPLPLASYRVRLVQHELEAHEDANVSFNVETDVNVSYDHLRSVHRSFPFSWNGLVRDDTSPEKWSLFYFLVDQGIDAYNASFMIMNLAVFARDASRSQKGVLTISLDIVLNVPPPEEFNELTELEIQESSLQEVRFTRASESSFKTLKMVKKKTKGVDVTEDQQCMVCLECFLDDTELARMPCGHEFHSHCIVKWLETSHLCPLCRHAMPVDPDCL